MEKTRRLWGGRFYVGQQPHTALEDINRSIDVDQRLYKQDIQGSIAYATALKKAGILRKNETEVIHEGLKKVQEEWKSGKFQLQTGDEDIHTANERRLSELVGANIGGKLHTGRSRNDQVSTDVRLWLKDASDELSSLLHDIIEVMATKAEEDIEILMPGYTHLQRAQPVRWSHWLLSHAWSLRSDRDKLGFVVSKVMAEMPLGSGALAGTPLKIDRTTLANDLGFHGVSNNSMYAVADRDFVVEFVFWSSLTSTHLSRLAEDLLLFSTVEFGFVRLHESLSTGSSLMPQKRNPDGLELVRAKSAVISGKCSTLLSLLKGLPSTYNKDLQEDKEAMFSAFDNLTLALRITLATVQGIQVQRTACQAALSSDMLATDLAYYLVRKGIPFREAHCAVGEVVRLAEEKGCSLPEVALTDLKAIKKEFDSDVYSVWSYEASVEQYEAQGGTSRASVLQQVNVLRSCLQNWRI